MNWKIKSWVQNFIASLPSALSYSAYYWIQRHFGRLKSSIPLHRFKAAAEMWRLILSLGMNPNGKTFFELGTGRVPNIPITIWLLGGKGTVTVDLNPYLKEDMLLESLDYMFNNKEEIKKILDPFLVTDHFNELEMLWRSGKASMNSVLEFCNIEYIAPADAANLEIDNFSIDFYTSFVVLEHIPPKLIEKIIEESNRIVKKEGLFIHRIDYGDHFAHTDLKISKINFLQYSDLEWEHFAGNRYMYMNRLRHDDFLKLFQSLNQIVLIDKPDIDVGSLDLLKSNSFHLDKKFTGKSETILATTSSWLVTQKVN